MANILSFGLLCTATGAVLGLLTFSRNRKNDIKSNVKNAATESAIIKTKLENIDQFVDSIRIDFKASDQRWTALSETVIRIDESTKQAHNCIDKIENKEEI
ncbi:hypothetical protein [Peribacillus sp. TH27]|uniref:hypothetical protein n=1 Tax=Peribacillus sp. TH27 TaxID=2798484 RepID=UPI0019129168|nr:hypothetical protein [Peribacillus sp. TH27]MBK5460441.1 hypothetical protein [Peribacillus sp. TH27]